MCEKYHFFTSFELIRKTEREIIFPEAARILPRLLSMSLTYSGILIFRVYDVATYSVPTGFGWLYLLTIRFQWRLVQTQDPHSMLIERFTFVEVQYVETNLKILGKISYDLEIEPYKLLY